MRRAKERTNAQVKSEFAARMQKDPILAAEFKRQKRLLGGDLAAIRNIEEHGVPQFAYDRHKKGMKGGGSKSSGASGGWQRGPRGGMYRMEGGKKVYKGK